MHLTLAMIVRDEARAVAATLASALPFVDSWVIADTGSVDSTVAEVERVCSGKTGRLLHVPFVDFSQARNAVLDAIEPGHVVLWLDADDRLVDGASLRFMVSIAPGNCWSLQHAWSTGQTFSRPTLVRAGSGWRFHGRVHEVLRHPSEREVMLLGPSIYQARSVQNDAATYARQAEDIEMLRAQIADEPHDARWREHLQRTEAAIALRDHVRSELGVCLTDRSH